LLRFSFLGGATFFFGPIIGAILLVLAFVLLSEFDRSLAALFGGNCVRFHGDVRPRWHIQLDHDEFTLLVVCVIFGLPISASD
jgi:ABC-type branched-subunit amino acid transport system permease subunit